MVYTNIAKAIVKNKLGLISYPSFITYLITLRCNARCIFCDVWKNQPDQKEELTVEEIKNIFQQLKKIDVLRISGGEPFLRTDIAEIVNEIEKINPPAMIHFTTNGTITHQVLEQVSKMKPLDKIHIKVSIDNVGDKHNDIRKVPDGFNKAIKTIEGLIEIRQRSKLHVGVNQVITDDKEIDAYFNLKEYLAKYDIPINPVIANQPTNSLYSRLEMVDPKVSFSTFGEFSKSELKRLFKIFAEDGKKINNFQEQIVDRYHLRGLYNRLVEEKNKPNPKCVTLNNHLRLLPNGDIPVCLYNGRVVGNLKNEKFQDVWFGEKIKKHREWVAKCPGCWQSCETAVSAIYTGDVWKGLLY